jgi:hypothetical protein
VGWVLSFENPNPGRRPAGRTGKAKSRHSQSRGCREPCVVADPRHARKLHAREPGYLRTICTRKWSRSACEGQGRTTSVNGTEESDCAIVPMNQPNKEAPTQEGVTAEAGEGRAWTKENISQGRTIPTQCGLFVVSQELIGMRQIKLTPCIQGRSRMR